jgi:fructokinase
MQNAIRVGLDLGGTKIEGIALDPAGRVLARQRVPTPKGDYSATVEAVAALAEQLERECSGAGARRGDGVRRGEPSGSPAPSATVGVGMPGVISPASGLVKNANSTWLNGRPFAADLSTRLGREVRCANDANCFALSEAVDGAAAGAHTVFGVIVGTGTGAGIVVDGRVLTGANAIAGEWGHNPMPWPSPDEWPGPNCYCGRTGCIETFLSGPGFARDFANDGEPIDAIEIVARAAAGDPTAEAWVRRYEERTARALASVINVLDPDVIVLGGGMSNIDRLYTNVPRFWPALVFSDTVVTRLVKAAHGDSSGVRGAAWLWNVEGGL